MFINYYALKMCSLVYPKKKKEKKKCSLDFFFFFEKQDQDSNKSTETPVSNYKIMDIPRKAINPKARKKGIFS